MEKYYDRVVAICKAASMISGLDVVVSFRTTHHSNGRGFSGQPMVAIGYDSRVDKFRKIENLWLIFTLVELHLRDYVMKHYERLCSKHF